MPEDLPTNAESLNSINLPEEGDVSSGERYLSEFITWFSGHPKFTERARENEPFQRKVEEILAQLEIITEQQDNKFTADDIAYLVQASEELDNPPAPAPAAAPTTPDTPPAAPATPDRPVAAPVTPDRVTTSPDQTDADGKVVIEGLGKFRTNVEGFHGHLIKSLNETLPDLKLRNDLAGGALQDKIEDLESLLTKLRTKPKKGERPKFNNNRDLPKINDLIKDVLEAPISTGQLAIGYKDLESSHNRFIGREDIKERNVGIDHIHVEHMERRLRAAQAELTRLQQTEGTNLKGKQLEEEISKLNNVKSLETVIRKRLSGEAVDFKEYIHLGSEMESDIARLLDGSGPEVKQVMTYKLKSFEKLLDQLKDSDKNNERFESGSWDKLVRSYQTALRDIYTERGELHMGDKNDDMIGLDVLRDVLTEANNRLEEAYQKEREDHLFSPKLIWRRVNQSHSYAKHRERIKNKFEAYESFRNDPEAELTKLFGRVPFSAYRIKKRDQRYQRQIVGMWQRANIQKRKELKMMGLLADLPKPEVVEADETKAEAGPETSPANVAEELQSANDSIERYGHILTLAAGVGVDTAELSTNLGQLKSELETVAGLDDDSTKASHLEAIAPTMAGFENKFREEIRLNELREVGPIKDEAQFKAYREVLKEHLTLLGPDALDFHWSVPQPKFADWSENLDGPYRMDVAYMTRLDKVLDNYEAIFKTPNDDVERDRLCVEFWAGIEDHLEDHYALLGLPYERTSESVENKDVAPSLKQFLDRDYRQFIDDVAADFGPYSERLAESHDGDQVLSGQAIAVYDAFYDLPENIKTADQNTELTDDELVKLEAFMSAADKLWNKLSPLRENHLAVVEAQNEYYEAYGGENEEVEVAAKSKFTEARDKLMKAAIAKLNEIPGIDQATKSEQISKLVVEYYLHHADKLNEKRLERLNDTEKRGLVKALLDKVITPPVSASLGASIITAFGAYTADRLTGGVGVASIAGSAVLGNVAERRIERFYSVWNEESRMDITRSVYDKLINGDVPGDDVDRLLLGNLKRKDRVKVVAASTGAVVGAVVGVIASYIPNWAEGWQSTGEVPVDIPVETPTETPAGPGAPLSPEAVGEVNDIISGETTDTIINLEQLQSDFVNDLIEGTRFESTPNDPAILNLKETIFGQSGLSVEQRLVELNKLGGLLNEETINSATEYIQTLE